MTNCTARGVLLYDVTAAVPSAVLYAVTCSFYSLGLWINYKLRRFSITSCKSPLWFSFYGLSSWFSAEIELVDVLTSSTGKVIAKLAFIYEFVGVDNVVFNKKDEKHVLKIMSFVDLHGRFEWETIFCFFFSVFLVKSRRYQWIGQVLTFQTISNVSRAIIRRLRHLQFNLSFYFLTSEKFPLTN